MVLLISPAALIADDWPQWFGTQRDGVWRETGIVKQLPKGGPKLRWKQTVGNGYAGPAVVNDRVYVCDRIAAKNQDPKSRKGIKAGEERVLCLDDSTGEIVWTFAYDAPYTVQYAAGPRCTPVVNGEYLYTLGAEGQLHCLTASNGELVWAKQFLTEFDVKAPVWGFAGSPLVEGDQLICLARGAGSTVVSFDKKTGAELWRAVTANEPGYCPPTVLNHGGKRVLLIWHPEAMQGLDLASGKELWSIPWKIRYGLTAPTPRHVGNQLFFTSFYNGSTMLSLGETARDEPIVAWQTERQSEKRTVHLNSIIGTPVFVDEHIYGGCSYGQFRCLQASDGKRLWESVKPIVGKEVRWGTVFITPHEDRYFLFSEIGELIIANLSPKGYNELSRAKLIEPNGIDLRQRSVVWSHPAYANQSIYVRNDGEIRCYSLRADS